MTFISQKVKSASNNLGNKDMVLDRTVGKITLFGSTLNESLVVEADGGQDIIKFQGDNDINIYSAANVNYSQFDQSQEKLKVANSEIGNLGTAAQYALKVYSRGGSSQGIAAFYNSTSQIVLDLRQASGHGLFNIKNSTGTSKVIISGNTGTVEAIDKFIVNGVNGFTGTGAFVNFTISGGIITNATI